MDFGAIIGIIVSSLIIMIIVFALIAHSISKRIKELKEKYGDLPFDELLNAERGEIGEQAVQRTLEKYLKNHKGYLINDVIIANLKGKTSQIDHVLFTPYGIFVVESKNYSDYIYGSTNDQYWTQVMGYDTKNRLFNPIIQNRTHCSRIGGILNERYGVISCIVFAQNNTENIKGCDEYVHNRSGLLRYLNKFNRVIYDDTKLLEMYNKINEYKIHPICTQVEHVNRVRRDW